MHIVKYSADWCKPCHDLAEMLMELNLDIEILYRDVDVEQEAAMKDNIRGVPTMIFFDDNGREKGRKVGSMSQSVFLEWLEEAMGC